MAGQPAAVVEATEGATIVAARPHRTLEMRINPAVSLA